MAYARHEKPGKPTSMRVTYRCGLARHSEWICFEHKGYPREKAGRWWVQRARDSAIPSTVEEALARTVDLPTPRSIQVRPMGRYTEIVAWGGSDEMPDLHATGPALGLVAPGADAPRALDGADLLADLHGDLEGATRGRTRRA